MPIVRIKNNEFEYLPENTATVSNYNLNEELYTQDGFSEISQELIDGVNEGKLKIENNKIVDNSQEYNSKQKSIKIADLQRQIDELDKKRIRAISEPQIKDIATGQTWLEYYTEQIVALRAEINNL